MLLNDEQKQFYGALEGTFRTPGWELIRQGWQEERDRLAEIVFHNAKSMDDVNAARVRYGILNELIGLAATIAAQRKHIENDVEELEDFV